jgi:hypothetical protein
MRWLACIRPYADVSCVETRTRSVLVAWNTNDVTSAAADERLPLELEDR